MKKGLFVCALALLSLFETGCRRTDVRAFTIDIPAMTAADETTIRSALGVYAGVQKSSLVFDFKAKKLHLQYDSMQLAKKNIEMAIAKAGFTANGVTSQSIGAKAKTK